MSADLLSWLDKLVLVPDAARLGKVVGLDQRAGKLLVTVGRTPYYVDPPAGQPKARPILFRGPMVRALLADPPNRKTMTRRPIKFKAAGDVTAIHDLGFQWGQHLFRADHQRGDGILTEALRCPYGQAGDLLWVKETWQSYWPEGSPAPTIRYRADEKDPLTRLAGPWRASMLMPRLHSRIVLQVAGVRAERLHAISDADCIAEGAPKLYRMPAWAPGEARESFCRLFSSIYGEAAWNANDWYWVVEFERISP